MEATQIQGDVPDTLFSLPQLQKVWVSVGIWSYQSGGTTTIEYAVFLV